MAKKTAAVLDDLMPEVPTAEPTAEPSRAETTGVAAAPLPAELQALVEQTRKDEIASLALFDRLASTSALTADERTWLRIRVAPPDTRTEIGFDRWLDKQAARMKAVRDWQRACGSPADRKVAAERAEAARQRQEDESPKLQAEIARIQAELQALADATAAAEADVQTRAAAVESLQLESRLPTFIKQSIRVLGKSIRADSKTAMDARNRVAALEHIFGLDPRDNGQMEEIKSWCNATYTSAGHLLEKCFPYRDGYYTPGEPNPRVFKPDAWAAYLPTLHAEVDELRATVARLGDPAAQIADELATLKNYWVPV